ncbi:MAG: beta-galactosidase [Ruminococcaceae bacterium]|nr:beta-galactosidase [Oscillospiraceae bacterium]
MSVSVNIPRAEHPNPQWERKNWKNLNGTWQFDIDNAQSGEARGLITAPTLQMEITVPFCPESSLSGIGNTDFMRTVWYKKAVSFAAADLEGNRVLLHFGAADFETTVWVNGQQAGVPHVGGFGSFSYDITGLLQVGENLITVKCLDDTRDGRQAGGKQSLRYESYGCFYTRTTGIWQTVWYEIVPEAHITYAKFLPDLENAAVTVLAELAGQGDLSARVFYEGRLVGEATKKNLSVTGQLEIRLSEVHVWEIGHGRLYDVELRFGADTVKSYFGLRSIAMRGRKFLLNGKSVFQRLVLDQGFYPDGIWTAPTAEALEKDIACSMSVGFNGARLHEKVFEPRFLYYADKMGYLVWGEYGNWGFDHSDIAGLATYLPDWLSAVRRDCNHPSVIGWCPFNETWDYGPDKKRQSNDLLRIIYEQTKYTDPTRPCIDTSGNYHVVTDIYDMHDYEQDVPTFAAHMAEILKGNTVDKNGGNRQQWDGEAPLFISEYGGIGFSLKGNSWSYGKAADDREEFYRRYRGLTDAILDNPLIMGFCYTQLTDVEQEQNGLFTYEGREPKFDVAVLAAINQRKAAIED